MKRSAHFARNMVVGIVIGLIVAFMAIQLITRSQWGMGRVRGVALGWLTARVQGDVRIGRITGGGLLRGATLHDVSIVGRNQRPFLEVDSARVTYNWRTLLGGNVVLTHVTLFRPRVHLEKLPGDTAWNYQFIFEDTTGGGPRTRKLIMFDDARIVDGYASVVLPVLPPIEPRDTARMITERFGSGIGRVMHFDSLQGRVSRALWESPLEPGRIFDIENVKGLAYVYRAPVRIESARGRLAMRDTIVSLDFPEVRLPSSRGAVMGRVIMEEGRNLFDIQIDLDNFAFRDMDWLYDRLPEQGGGRGQLRILSQPAGTLFLAENARLTTPGTNVSGAFGVVVGDTMYFTKVDLRASPLDIKVIERMLPNGLPIDGILMGTVEVKGPLARLEVKGDMTLASNGATSAARFDGTLNARARTVGAGGMHADVRDFDLALIRAIQPAFTLAGRMTGRVDARPDNAGGVFIDADLEHRNGVGAVSRFTGGGLLLGTAGARTLDMRWTAEALSLDELAVQYPALKGLSGNVSGPVRLTGPLNDLRYVASLTTAGGIVDVGGSLRRTGGRPRYGGSGTLVSFALDRFDKRLPDGNVSGRFAFDLGGTSLIDADGTIRVDLDSARFLRVPVQNAVAAAHLDAGVLRFDTLRATTIAGDVAGHGGLGIAAGTSAKLDLGILSESVAGLEANFFGESSADAAETPRLAGSIRGTATIDGSIHGATLAGNAMLGDVVVGPLRAEAAAVRVEGRLFDSTGAVLHATAHADTLRGYKHTFQVADIAIHAANDSIGISLTGGDADVKRFRVSGRADSLGTTSRRFHLAELTLGGTDPWRLEAPALLQWQNNRMEVSGLTLRSADSAASADALGVLMWNDATAPMDFHFGLHGVSVADFLRLAHRDVEGAGSIEGGIRITGTPQSPFVTADMNVAGLRYGDLRLESVFGEVSYANEDLETFFEAKQAERRVLSGGGHAPLDLRFMPVAERKLNRPLAVSFLADSLPLGLPLGVLPGFTSVTGRLDGTLAAAGTSLDPVLSGALDVRDGAALWDATGVHYYGVNGSAKLVSDRAFDVLATGRSGTGRTTRGFSLLSAGDDGTATVSGRLDFTELTDPTFDLELNAVNLLAVKRREADITLTGDMQLAGRYTRPEVTGEITVEEGSLYLDEVYKRYLIVELDPSLLFNVVDTALVSVRRVLPISDNPFLNNLLISNAVVHVSPRDAWLRSRDLDVLVGGDIQVEFDRRSADLRMTGTLAVERGTYQLAYPPLQARRFQVREGTIEFPGTPGIDPNLSITAAYRAPTKSEPLDILAVVSGSLQTPRVRLTSDAQPPISESDLASYLFFGAPSWEVASFRNGTSGLNADFGLRTFAPSVLGYAASGLQTLGQRFGLLDYVGITAAEAVPGQTELNNAFANFFASTQVDLGLYILPEVYLGITKRITGSPGARVEWRYSPTYTAQIFIEDRFANTPSFGLQREAGLRRVAGFFLFREWGY